WPKQDRNAEPRFRPRAGCAPAALCPHVSRASAAATVSAGSPCFHRGAREISRHRWQTADRFPPPWTGSIGAARPSLRDRPPSAAYWLLCSWTRYLFLGTQGRSGEPQEFPQLRCLPLELGRTAAALIDGSQINDQRRMA